MVRKEGLWGFLEIDGREKRFFFERWKIFLIFWGADRGRRRSRHIRRTERTGGEKTGEDAGGGIFRPYAQSIRGCLSGVWWWCHRPENGVPRTDSHGHEETFLKTGFAGRDWQERNNGRECLGRRKGVGNCQGWARKSYQAYSIRM